MPYFYRAYGLLISSDFLLPPLRICPPTSAIDLIIRRGSLPAQPHCVSSKAYRAGLNAQLAHTTRSDLWLNWPSFGSFRALNGGELIVDTDQTDGDLIALFILSEALGLILFQREYFLLHGSAIQIGNQGVVFLGEPGAGKSTTVAAFAAHGSRVISDDMVCIRPDKTGGYQLIPSFSQLKIWESAVAGLQLGQQSMTPVREGVDKFSWHESITFNHAPLPLNRIFVLLPPNAPGSIDVPLINSQIPVELLHHFPLPDALLVGQELKDFFVKSVGIARTIPLFRMSRPADFAALQTFVEYLNVTCCHENSSLR